jgi:hypothetical protein
MTCEYFHYQSTNSQPLTKAVETGHVQFFHCQQQAKMTITTHGQTKRYCLPHGYGRIEFLESNPDISYG